MERLTYKMQGAKEPTQGFPDVFRAWLKVNIPSLILGNDEFVCLVVFFFFFSFPFVHCRVVSDSTSIQGVRLKETVGRGIASGRKPRLLSLWSTGSSVMASGRPLDLGLRGIQSLM